MVAMGLDLSPPTNRPEPLIITPEALELFESIIVSGDQAHWIVIEWTEVYCSALFSLIANKGAYLGAYQVPNLNSEWK